MTFQKLGDGGTVYNVDTTLSGLWRAWMRLNRLTEDQVRDLLRDKNIRCNFDGCLRDTWDDAALTRSAGEILALTGIRIDEWMVIEAKRRARRDNPELAGRMTFDHVLTRTDVVNELRRVNDEYGGTWYVALQIGLAPSLVNTWVRADANRLPTVDKMASVFVGLARGFITNVTCLEDVMFALVVRTVFGYERETVFPEFPTFAKALEAFFHPHKGWTVSKIAGAYGVSDGKIKTLQDWRSQPGKGTLYHDSIQLVLRAHVERRWPNLVTRFDALCAEYRAEEEKGIWKVSEPLRPPLDATRPAAAPEPARVSAPRADVPPAPAPREEPTVPQPPARTARQAPAAPAVPAATTVEEKLALVFDYGAKVFRGEMPAEFDARREVGGTLGELRNCLTKDAYRPNPDGRVNPEQIRELAADIGKLRKILVMLAELDPGYLRREVTPILAPELVELIIGFEGLRHLLGTDEAWEVISGMRAGMSTFVRSGS